MQALLPAPLLRSLRRFSDCHEDVNAADVSQSSPLLHGVLLGTQKLVQTSRNDVHQIAIWALLRQPSDDCAGQSFDRNLPGGISRIGSFVVVRGDAIADDEKTEAVALRESDKQPEAAEKVVLVYGFNSQTLRVFRCKDGRATAFEVKVVPCFHAQEFHRAIGYALLRCVVDLDAIWEKSALSQQLEKYKAAAKDSGNFYVRAAVMEGENGRIFRVLNSAGEDSLSSDAKLVSLEAILPTHDVVEDTRDTKKTKKKNGKKQKKVDTKAGLQRHGKKDDTMGMLPSLEYGAITTVDLMVSLAPLESSAAAVAPVVTIPALSVSRAPSRRFGAYCDALVVVSVDLPLSAALDLLRDQVYLRLSEVADRLKDAQEAVNYVAVHQFPLVGAAFPLTVASSSEEPSVSEKDMDDVKALESLHCAFLQPLDQPLFCLSRGCSLAQQAEWLATSDVLYNVHEGVASFGGGLHCQIALVDGFYGYYHYLQQDLNDKGWGCAYRSLQTLASWLFMQHYTQQRYLSHQQIQSVLVKMGDKPTRFEGSTEWIGSLEVGYVLDELFGVTFRSLSVSSGAQLPGLARELLCHFETQGTPVMMGGGQLAFTLLGVDYDPDTGVCAFLTLDPHYTGNEDLHTIQNQVLVLEGYKAVPCSWRKTTSFAKNSFYNLCLPQRPSVDI
uniref:UFSP1/2/DUB catalytic domain-containing protein n=1 Tax=Peronospora matthiolae TaxID=2874970 RepID=A0AAV1TVM0_9STRA